MSAFVHGLTQEHAQALLAIAKEQGLSPDVVATTDDGFVVPESVADAFMAPAVEAAESAEAEKPKPARRTRKAQD